MNKTKAACYCRVSTKKSEQELSLENQQSFFLRYAEQQNLELFCVYQDDGVSAKSMKKRDGFLRMVADAKKGLFQKILVKDVSRFARNTCDFLSAIRELKSFGIEVLFVTANMTTYDSELMLTILAAVAQEESANLSKRVRFAKELSAKEGRVPNIVYGYNKASGSRFELQINPAEAAIVRRIFDLYANQGMSSRQIARQLNEERVATKRGGTYQWSPSVVCGLLQNRLYIGEVCNQKSCVTDFITGQRNQNPQQQWVVASRPQFRILSDELFLKAQAVRQSRSTANRMPDSNSNRRPSSKHPLSNLLVCANDHRSFRRKIRRYAPSDYEYIYWTCSERDCGIKGCNNAVKLAEKALHRAISDFLLAHIENKEQFALRLQKKTMDLLLRQTGQQRAVKELKKEQKRLFAQREKLTDLFLEEGINKDSFIEKLFAIEERLAKTTDQLANCAKDTKPYADTEQQLLQAATCMEHILPQLLDNAFLKEIFQKLTVYPDGKIIAQLVAAQQDDIQEIVSWELS